MVTVPVRVNPSCEGACTRMRKSCPGAIVPGAAVKIVVRTSLEPHEAPFVSGIPTEGPLALRELPLYAPTYRDSRTPIVCPRCGAAATRHRALTSALVCPHCARSFEV